MLKYLERLGLEGQKLRPNVPSIFPQGAHPEEVRQVLDLHSRTPGEKDKDFWDEEFQHYLGIPATKAMEIIGIEAWKKLTGGKNK